jgi:hypothetical protein
MLIVRTALKALVKVWAKNRQKIIRNHPRNKDMQPFTFCY